MKTVQHLLDAKIGLVAVGAAIAALGIAVHFSLMSEVRLAESRIDEVAHLEAELHREIGYGGLIHNFKNYVLRGSENYRVAAMRDHRRASSLLDQLSEIVDGVARADLDAVRVTLDAYRDNLDVAAAARARGRDAEEIDQLVKIDDSQAIHAIGVRMHATRLTLVDARDALREEQMQVFVALCVFLGAIIVIVTLITRGIALRMRALEEACGEQLHALRRRAEKQAQPTNARSIT
jgi:hypothetical protein